MIEAFSVMMMTALHRPMTMQANSILSQPLRNASAISPAFSPPAISACAMFVVQDIFNVLVPSGSGQAAITMPIMAPLADVIGVTRQTAVLAFQMGDSFTNVLAPTSGEVIAAIAMAKIPYGKWVKWLLPLFGIWCLIAFASLIIAVTVGYGPF